LKPLCIGYLALGPPVPADLDDDGDLEILFGHWGGGASNAYGTHHDGGAVAGFPIQIATSSQLFYVGLGDVTGDGAPELVVTDNHLGGDYRVFAIDIPTAATLTGWPFDLADWPKGFPTVADVDDDGVQDVCLATDGGELYAVAGDGQVIGGYPKQMVAPSISGVAAGDIDGDGLLELVAATWDGWVYAWDTTGEALPERADWPMRGINARNTGVFGDAGTTTAVRAAASSPTRGVRVEPNPVLFRAEFVFDFAPSPTTLEIYDSGGRLVDILVTGGGSRMAWRPRASTPPGVYFARLTGSETTGSVAFIVLR